MVELDQGTSFEKALSMMEVLVNIPLEDEDVRDGGVDDESIRYTVMDRLRNNNGFQLLHRGVARAMTKTFAKKFKSNGDAVDLRGWSGSLVGGKTGISLEELLALMPEKTTPLNSDRSVGEFAMLVGFMRNDLESSGDESEATKKANVHKRIFDRFDLSEYKNLPLVEAAIGEYAATLAAMSNDFADAGPVL